jgi:hypothetical protein
MSSGLGTLRPATLQNGRVTPKKPFEAHTTRPQREAAARARADAGLTGPEIVDRAAKGLLQLDGEPVGPFIITQDYVRKLASALITERQGKRASPLAKMAADEAHEALRTRLINLADAELNHIERQRVGKRDVARFRDIVRAVKEAAAIQPPKAKPRAPGAGVPGERVAERTRSGNTGALLAAMRGRNGDEPAEAGSSDGATDAS